MGIEGQRLALGAGVGGERFAVPFGAKGFIPDQGAERLILIA
jgi:hypothetical protein